MTLARRDFLRVTGKAAAGLTIAFHLPALGEPATAAAASFEPNAFLRIGGDGVVTLWSIRLEMGQGVRTILPMMVAEELEVDWTAVRVEQSEPGGKFAGVRLHTSGSGSSSGTYRTLRTAGAAAREMLVAAAAAAWSVDAGTCKAAHGRVRHVPTSRTLSYGELVARAATLPVPQSPALKDPKRFTLLGTPVKRVDGPAIVTGRAQYGLDVRVPNMLFASIERAPSLGGRLVRFDAAAALKIPGVRHVVPVTSGILQGVAVVADDTWTALRGRRALGVEWVPGVDFDSERFLEELPRALERAEFKVRHEGDAPGVMASAARRHEATYIFPFQAHAPMETMNCTADVRAGSAEIWAPTQTDVRTIDQVKKVTGLPAEAIRLHPIMMGGGFGRRLFADYAAEAAELSKAIARPVQVMWTREDDMQRGYFQPATAERFTAGVDASGRLTALIHKTSASDLTIYDIHGGRDIWRDAKEAKKPDHFEGDQSPWGAYDNPYEFPNLRVDCADVTSPVPVGPWRAVQYPSTVFARESFLDEVAHLTSKDPIALRLELLPRDVKAVGPYKIDRARLARVLEAVRDRSRWGSALPPQGGRKRGCGVAASVYHAGSYIAMVAEVSVAEDGSDLRVERVTTAVDAGVVLNPSGLLGQTESGIAWGLSYTLLGKMNFKAGSPAQANFSTFQVLRFGQMPSLDTLVLESSAPPGGYGEHPVPLVAPAVANALFAATGRRVRTLPLA